MMDGKKGINKKIRGIVANQLDVDVTKVNENSHLVNDLGMDSFSAVELAFELKDQFDIEIPQEDFRKINSVKDIVVYISRRIGKG